MQYECIKFIVFAPFDDSTIRSTLAKPFKYFIGLLAIHTKVYIMYTFASGHICSAELLLSTYRYRYNQAVKGTLVNLETYNTCVEMLNFFIFEIVYYDVGWIRIFDLWNLTAFSMKLIFYNFILLFNRKIEIF